MPTIPKCGTHRLISTALLTAVLSACGGEASNAQASADASSTEAITAIDACALLTAEEIETATGILPGPPEDVTTSGGVPSCNWPPADGSNPVFLTVLVGPGFASFDEYVQATQEGMTSFDMEFDPASVEEVEGVGEFGVWLSEEAWGGMLQGHSGGRMVQVYAPAVAQGRDRREASAALARYAVSRLP